MEHKVLSFCAWLCVSRLYLHIHFYPFSQCWVAQAHQGAPITLMQEWPALPSLCWSISGSLPCPLHQCLWQPVGHVPSPLSAGEATGSAVLADVRASSSCYI